MRSKAAIVFSMAFPPADFFGRQFNPICRQKQTWLGRVPRAAAASKREAPDNVRGF
jgi:hypothetical protein